MPDQPPAAHIVATLASFGVEADEVDEAVIGVVLEQFGGGIQALLEVDLEGVEPEPDLDPSKPPRDG